MKISDFYIGLEFMNSAQSFRCTDVGTRTVSAIALDKDDERWYVGPPYMVEERLFDEKAIEHLFLNATHAIEQSVSKGNDVGLSYSSGAVKIMMGKKYSPKMAEYRNKPLLRHDKVIEGEIHHPYAAELVDDVWHVESYLPYLELFSTTLESIFRDAPMAVHQDYLDSKARHSK